MEWVWYIQFKRACSHLSRAQGDEFSVMASSIYQKQTLGYIYARPISNWNTNATICHPRLSCPLFLPDYKQLSDSVHQALSPKLNKLCWILLIGDEKNVSSRPNSQRLSEISFGTLHSYPWVMLVIQKINLVWLSVQTEQSLSFIRKCIEHIV